MQYFWIPEVGKLKFYVSFATIYLIYINKLKLITNFCNQIKIIKYTFKCLSKYVIGSQ